MTKFATFAVSIALGSAVLTSPLFADSQARVLRIGAGYCPSFKSALETWAGQISGHGSYAVPIAPKSLKLTCDNPGPAVPVGQSYGFDNFFEADQAALNYCEEHKPADFSGCVVVARSLPAR